jgi:predicted HNH restriction endonuclease
MDYFLRATRWAALSRYRWAHSPESAANASALANAYRNKTPFEKPRRKDAQQLVYERSPLVIAITRKRAGYSCEVEGCTSPTFVTDDGERFVEVHHLTPLAQGGEDTIENTACLCPTHHRGKLRQQPTASLRAISARRA